MSLNGKTVLISGAGRGIGKRLAIGFAAEGARVGLLARSRTELDLARLEIADAGGMALTLPADVCDFGQVCEAVSRLRGEFGPIEVAVAAAAVQGPIGPLYSVDPKRWVEAIEVNLLGVMHLCRSVLPEMIQRRRGKIVALTGGGTTKPRANFSAYAASKTAVARFVETVATEVLDFNVQINCMSPGGTYTHMTDEILNAGIEAGAKDYENARQVCETGGTPPVSQIQLALFLASERSNHISGKIIHVKDAWNRLEHAKTAPELFTLRRVLRR